MESKVNVIRRSTLSSGGQLTTNRAQRKPLSPQKVRALLVSAGARLGNPHAYTTTGYVVRKDVLPGVVRIQRTQREGEADYKTRLERAASAIGRQEPDVVFAVRGAGASMCLLCKWREEAAPAGEDRSDLPHL